MSYKQDIEKLEKELQSLKSRQYSLETSCTHNWTDAKFDPEDYTDYAFSHYEVQGVDMWPVMNSVARKKR